MMYFVTIIFIIAVVITLIVYYRKTTLDERYSFNSLSTLFQTLFVFITLWITIYTIRSSNSDSEKLFSNLDNFNSKFSKMDISLNRVSEKLSKLPKQLDEFSESINSLNSIQLKQSEDFKKNTARLNETINSLHTTVRDYEDNIVDYSEQLKSIVKQTDQQLNIWKEQQRVMLDEISRKPLLKIEPRNYSVKNDTTFINDLVLTNNGKIEASILSIFVKIPSDMVLSFKSQFFKKTGVRDNFDRYLFITEGTNVSVIPPGRPIILSFNMKLLNKKLGAIFIGYQIDYYSRYDTTGTKSDFIILPK